MNNATEATTETGSLTRNQAGSLISSLYQNKGDNPAKETPANSDTTEQKAETKTEVNDESQSSQKPGLETDQEDVDQVESESSEDEVEDQEYDDQDTDDETGESDDTDDNSEAEESNDDDDVFEISLGDGQTEDVTFDELVNGYMRQKDYTQKTQALAEQRKQVETLQEEMKDLPQLRQSYRENGDQFLRNASVVVEALKARIPAEPDPRMFQDNMEQYVVLKEQRQEQINFVKTVLGEVNRVQKGAQDLKAKQINEAGIALKREYPKLDNEEEAGKLRKWIKTQGYSDNDINNHGDYKTFIWAHKAMLYDALMEKAKDTKPKYKKPKMLKTKNAREDQGSTIERQRKKAVKTHKNVRTVKSAGNAIAENIKASSKKRRR